MKIFYKKYWKYLTLILIPLIIFSVVVIIRGSDAFYGITWGFRPKDFICDNFESISGNLCKPDIVDFKSLTVNFGIYDPQKVYENDTHLAIDSIYISWKDYNNSGSNTVGDFTLHNNRWMMVTVEPWPMDIEGLTKETLFKDISDGKYDTSIKNICQTFDRSANPVFVRWGHEMENVTDRYPWASNDNQGFINSYRYFVTKCREFSSKSYYVWSPVGDVGLEKYYPGSEYVDYIGLSVYGFEEADKYYFGRARSFNEIFWDKYNRVINYSKPLMIAELGVTGTDAHRKLWMSEALKSFSWYKGLKTVVLFNSKDKPGAWESKFQVPDWSINWFFDLVKN